MPFDMLPIIETLEAGNTQGAGRAVKDGRCATIGAAGDHCAVLIGDRGLPPMDDNGPIKKYPFQGANEEGGYCLFPDELENDEHVFFHGTAEANLPSIIDNGFRIAGSLPSVSFARTSALALRYACAARTGSSPNGCVLAVRFDSLDNVRCTEESFGIHVYRFDQQPIVIGYCVVPAAYVFR
jgi:hypothetical protein